MKNLKKVLLTAFFLGALGSSACYGVTIAELRTACNSAVNYLIINKNLSTDHDCVKLLSAAAIARVDNTNNYKYRIQIIFKALREKNVIDYKEFDLFNDMLN